MKSRVVETIETCRQCFERFVENHEAHQSPGPHLFIGRGALCPQCAESMASELRPLAPHVTVQGFTRPPYGV